MSLRVALSLLAVISPATVQAKTVKLDCEVIKSSATPSNAQSPNAAVGEKYTFLFDDGGGQGQVTRNGRESSGKPIEQVWTPTVELSPTHANFAFQVQHTPSTAVIHQYRIDRSTLRFTGHTDAFGYVQFEIEGMCKQAATPQRSNRF